MPRRNYLIVFSFQMRRDLESAKKLGVASFREWPRPLNWKSTSASKTCLEHFIAKILPFKKIFTNDGF